LSAGIEVEIATSATELQDQIDSMGLTASVMVDLSAQGVQDMMNRRASALLDELTSAGQMADAMQWAAGSVTDLASNINDQVHSKGWSYASKYGAVQKINGILGMTPEQLRNVSLQEMSQLYEALQNMAEHGQTEDMRNYGRMLLEGLVYGLKHGGVDWQAVADEQGGELLSAFKVALGINSPSKYTIEMGRYLMEGLNVGF